LLGGVGADTGDGDAAVARKERTERDHQRISLVIIVNG